MAKEINTRNKININNIVYFFGDDLDIYYSLESLSLETKKFRLQKKEFTKKKGISFRISLRIKKRCNFKRKQFGQES